MKKIVKGKLYDTEIAERVYEELYFNKRRTLYRTDKGTWFIHYHANNEIVPKTNEEVMEYLGERDVDLYIKYFGEVENA
jgi:hypothetical protein